jgi:hypothetical protein
VHAVVECEDGWVVKIGVNGRESLGAHSYAINKWAVVRVEREAGFTLSALEDQLIMPLRTLISIVTHERAECFNLRLQPVDEAYRPTFPIHVDPEVRKTSGVRQYGQPVFTPDQVDVPSFISAWIRLARRNIVPVYAVEPGDNGGSLQEQVVAIVNAAETLHRALHVEPNEFPFAQKVWDALKGVEGLNRREREKVRSALRFVEFSLKDRLQELAVDLGSDFCDWYLQCEVENWAVVSSAVRNALSHGYDTSHSVEHDFAALAGIVQVTKSIIALRLLVAAGLPTGAALIDVIKKDRAHLAVVKQSVADWRSLAAKIHGV